MHGSLRNQTWQSASIPSTSTPQCSVRWGIARRLTIGRRDAKQTSYKSRDTEKEKIPVEARRLLERKLGSLSDKRLFNQLLLS